MQAHPLLASKSLFSKRDLKSRHEGLSFLPHTYASAGHDQITLHVLSLAKILQILQDPEVILAGRDLILRCMRKGPSQWARNHHPWVVDAALEHGGQAASLKKKAG